MSGCSNPMNSSESRTTLNSHARSDILEGRLRAMPAKGRVSVH